MKDHRLVAELLSLLGEDDLIRLAEEHAGIRLYVPSNIDRSQLIETVGADIANRLSRRYGGDYISVPMVRDIRARRYRDQDGLSNSQIARRLGITESGVEKLFNRSPVKYRTKKSDDRQIEMFPSE
ncbi:Mor transcription activator family protein [Ochrobactrum teleogrylli]|uniref:Mor transcription activator family protein n=1 Tax=Ochrobactrum teleogrylli TaxID=2479765 RepID=UPI001F43D47F|nr:Mor transcription activator family protein [[Ochrobactrum] teleogrylli]